MKRMVLPSEGRRFVIMKNQPPGLIFFVEYSFSKVEWFFYAQVSFTQRRKGDAPVQIL